jgi:RNA polymerase sigma-70 factor (ECF subfamily)
MKAAFRLSLEYRRGKCRADARHSDCDVDSLVNRFPAPDEALSMRQDRMLLDLALEKLAPEMRAAFVLFELEGMTFSEIAESLGIPRGTVASRVRRARLEFTKAVQRLAPKGER